MACPLKVELQKCRKITRSNTRLASCYFSILYALKICLVCIQTPTRTLKALMLKLVAMEEDSTDLRLPSHMPTVSKGNKSDRKYLGHKQRIPIKMLTCWIKVTSHSKRKKPAHVSDSIEFFCVTMN